MSKTGPKTLLLKYCSTHYYHGYTFLIGNDPLQKVLHNRQLGLKLIANVTYGYTAANFSGRMCCVEVGDSVVSKGRETLQRAIALVESTPEWGAKVSS